MKLPTWQPRDRQMSERRHYDPPALWYAVILGSVVIHLSAFGILRLLIMGGLIGTPSATKLIPIDVIAMATPAAGIASSKPNATSATRLPPKTVTKATPKPTTKSNQTQNRPNTSTDSPTRTKTPPVATKQPAANIKKSPTANPSKPSEKVQPQTKPNTPTTINNQPVAGTNNQPSTTKSPNSPSPTNSPTNKPTPNSQSGGGFIATFDNLTPSATIDIPNPDQDNDKLATLLDDKKQLSAEDLKQLGISLNQDLKLKVGVVVETDGTATVIEKQVVVEQGSISQEKAVALAQKIISQLRFTPTLGNGKPKPGNYNLQLKISPAQT